MKRLSLIRQIWIVFWRDVISPGAGLYLLLVDPKLQEMQPWQAPIVAALLGFPLAARGLTESKKDRDSEDE